jgi:formate dehydrogenase subunit gamma
MNEPRYPEQIHRYTANERTSHWLTAISFVLAALSGLALYHPATSWLAALFGGGPWTRILHPFIGVFMFVVFLLLALRMWRHNRIDARDRQWLRQLDDVVNNREEHLPEVGKYNAGQKLLFFSLVVCMLGLLLSGLVMWRPWLAAAFPINAVRAASLLHAFFATVLIVLIIVHVYSAIWVAGSTRAMVRGYVSRGWAWKHHRAWLRDVDRESGGGPR